MDEFNDLDADLFDEDFEDDFEEYEFDEDDLEDIDDLILAEDEPQAQISDQHKQMAPTQLRAGAICLLFILRILRPHHLQRGK